MSGIFSSGVLKSFEDAGLASRVHSVYAVSVGACTGARFLAGQSELGGRTFYTRFNDKRFLRGHFARYFFQVLLGKMQPDDILGFDYFTDILHNSEVRIEIQKVTESEIPLYVKVFNVGRNTHEYLRVQEPDAYNKVLASASMTPLTSKRIIINSEEFFDGDTIASDLDRELVRNNPDKLIIKMSNCRSSFLEILNLPVLLIIYTLLLRMYGIRIANLYFKSFFRKPFLERSFATAPNVLSIENDLPVSSFTKNAEVLKKVYKGGLEKGVEALQRIKTPGDPKTSESSSKAR